MSDEHDRLEAQYEAMKAKQKGKGLAGAFMQGWSRAKLHSATLESAFESWRVCLEPDVMPIDIMLRKLGQIRKLALASEGHAFDLIIALVDEALAAGSGTAKTAKPVECEASQSGGSASERNAQNPPPKDKING